MMANYNKKNVFWKDFQHLPESPYILGTDMSGFKCLFVHLTAKNDFSGRDYPISFGYLASILRMNKAKVKILAQDMDSYVPELFSGYDLICFYPMAFSLKRALEYAGLIKNTHSNASICFLNSDQHQHEMLLCSPDAENFAKALMDSCLFIDYILIGPAERSLLELCEKLLKGETGFAGVSACFYRQQGKIKFSGAFCPQVDFNYLPFPSRDYFEKGVSSGGVNEFSFRVQSSRGCVSRCSYCVESSANFFGYFGNKAWLGRQMNKFVDEIEIIARDFKAVFFNIIDSSFEDPGAKGIARMRQFFEEIKLRNIRASFKIHLRAETIEKLADSDLEAMKGAGVDIIVLGVESGIERELRSYNKITTVEKSIKNIRRLDDFGKFFSLFGHMMFSACLRLEDLPEKSSFLERTHRGWDYLNLSNNVLAFRGTAYHSYLKEHRLDRELENLSVVIPYAYADERVRFVANEMGGLKIKFPEVIHLNNLLYDAQNMASRYYNKINEHLWCQGEPFERFREGLRQSLLNTEKVFICYFSAIVDLAFHQWDPEKAQEARQEYIASSLPGLLSEARGLINNFLDAHRKKGLSTESIYLKTWMSLINTQANTSSGMVK